MAQTTNSIDKQEKKEHTLSIQVRLDGFSFFIQNVISKAITTYRNINFQHKVDPNHLLKELHQIYAEEKILLESYSHINVIYINPLFTLVPKALFKEEHLTDYLKFNTKLLKTDFVTYDELNDQELVNVYIPYTNANNFFFDQYGSFSYHHGVSILIAHSNDQTLQLKQNHVIINVQPHSFDLLVIKDSKVVLANSFDYQTKEDFIYYLLFTIEQLDLDPETIKLSLTGHIIKESDLYQLIYTYVREICLLPSTHEAIPQEDYLLSTLI